MSDHKLTLRVVVNGMPVEVEVNPNAPLRTIVLQALHEAKVVGQPPENWRVLDADDRPLDLGQKIGTFGFVEGTTLWMSLKAGIGG